MKPDTSKCGEIFRCGPGKFIFTCALCSENFNSKSKALIHIEDHFFVGLVSQTKYEKDQQTESKNVLAKIEIETLDYPDEYSVCVSPDQDDKEIKHEPEASCNTPEIIFADSSKQMDKSRNIRWGPTHTKTLVECDLCKNFMRKTSLVAHLQSHTNLKQFVCTQCKRRYNTRQQLTKHTKIHSDFKKFSCDKCGWQFHDRANLIQHFRRHTGEKPYKCKVCNKSFAQSNTAIVHMRTHTGEKPYKCTMCDKAFNAQNVLKRHLRRHTNQKTFKCDNCEKTFFCGTALRDHRRSQHTGERPYVCDICKCSFSRRGAFREHVILHTGLKPYKCRFCDLSFAQGAGRRSHERSIHKDVADTVLSKTKLFVVKSSANTTPLLL